MTPILMDTQIQRLKKVSLRVNFMDIKFEEDGQQNASSPSSKEAELSKMLHRLAKIYIASNLRPGPKSVEAHAGTIVTRKGVLSRLH